VRNGWAPTKRASRRASVPDQPFVSDAMGCGHGHRCTGRAAQNRFLGVSRSVRRAGLRLLPCGGRCSRRG
jgi:hypothetical protein